jgi:hypothetical protein
MYVRLAMYKMYADGSIVKMKVPETTDLRVRHWFDSSTMYSLVGLDLLGVCAWA